MTICYKPVKTLKYWDSYDIENILNQMSENKGFKLLNIKNLLSNIIDTI